MIVGLGRSVCFTESLLVTGSINITVIPRSEQSSSVSVCTSHNLLSTLQLQSSGTRYRHGCAVPPLVVDSSGKGLKATFSYKSTHDPLKTLVLRVYLLTYLLVGSLPFSVDLQFFHMYVCCCRQRVFKDDELSMLNTCLLQLDFMADFRHRCLLLMWLHHNCPLRYV